MIAIMIVTLIFGLIALPWLVILLLPLVLIYLVCPACMFFLFKKVNLDVPMASRLEFLKRKSINSAYSLSKVRFLPGSYKVIFFEYKEKFRMNCLLYAYFKKCIDGGYIVSVNVKNSEGCYILEQYGQSIKGAIRSILLHIKYKKLKFYTPKALKGAQIKDH